MNTISTMVMIIKNHTKMTHKQAYKWSTVQGLLADSSNKILNI
jgi:hypothetical protein